MNKGTLYVNKILKKKWIAREVEIHKQRLAEVKPFTDTKQPLSL